MTKHKAKKSTIDGALLAVVAVLLVYGLLALYSATFYVGSSFWKRQLVWIAVGLVVAIAAYRIPYPFWQKVAPILMLVNLLALLITVVYAKPVLGASRGLIDLSRRGAQLGRAFGLGSSVQPGVLARLVTVIYVAAWLASKGEQLNQVKRWAHSLRYDRRVGGWPGVPAARPEHDVVDRRHGLAMFFFAGRPDPDRAVGARGRCSCQFVGVEHGARSAAPGGASDVAKESRIDGLSRSALGTGACRRGRLRRWLGAGPAQVWVSTVPSHRQRLLSDR